MLIRHASTMSGLPAPAGVTDSESSTGHYTMPNVALSAYLLQAECCLVCLSATGRMRPCLVSATGLTEALSAYLLQA